MFTYSVNVEVTILGSPSLISLMVSVDIKAELRNSFSLFPHLHTPFPRPLPFFPSLISLMVSVDVKHHVYLLCESRGGRPGLPVPRAQELPLPLPPSPYPLLPVPNKPYGFCGRKATSNRGRKATRNLELRLVPSVTSRGTEIALFD